VPVRAGRGIGAGAHGLGDFVLKFLSPLLDIQRFRWLAGLTTLLVFVQITLGAVVRVSGSGLGCGNNWPLCGGRLTPVDRTTAIIEYGHRAVGATAGLLVVLTLLTGWLLFRRNRSAIVWLLVATAVLIMVEAALGALVVFNGLAGLLVLLHLAIALTLIALLLTIIVRAYDPTPTVLPRRLGRQMIISIGVTFVLVLSGAAVVATDSDRACKSWPLCAGGLPANAAASYTTVHRLLAGIFGLFVAYTLIRVIRSCGAKSVPGRAATLTLLLILLQVAVGYPVAVKPIMLFQGLHVALATGVWCGIVTVGALTLNSRELEAHAHWRLGDPSDRRGRALSARM